MPNLTIRAVEAVPLALPLVTPITGALGTYRTVTGVAVRLHTDEGSGFGFNLGPGGAPSRALATYIDDELAPLAIGADGSRPAELWHRLWGPNKPRMRGGLGVWALSAIDIAGWDLVGRSEGRSIHSMIGGSASSVPVYGSGGWHSLSDDELVDECRRFAGLGMTAYKFKIGSPRDRERVALLRAEMGDEFTLLADANQGFDVETALEVSTMLAEFGVAWFEEPVLADTPDDLARVARDSVVPIAAGENVYFRWGFRDICDRAAARFLQPNVTRCGGITEFVEIAKLAERHGLHLTSHLWHELSISLVGASSAGWAAEYTELVSPEVWTRDFAVADGRISVPDVPGTGVELTDAALRLSV